MHILGSETCSQRLCLTLDHYKLLKHLSRLTIYDKIVQLIN